jgi:hypothetical protein
MVGGNQGTCGETCGSAATVMRVYVDQSENLSGAIKPRHDTRLAAADNRPSALMPSHSQFAAPLAGMPRPPLPVDHLNPHIKSRQCPFSFTLRPHLTPASVDVSNLPAVKFQEIIREGQSTIVRPLPSCSRIIS